MLLCAPNHSQWQLTLREESQEKIWFKEKHVNVTVRIINCQSYDFTKYSDHEQTD